MPTLAVWPAINSRRIVPLMGPETMRQHYTTTRTPSRLAAAALAVAIGLALATVLFFNL